MLADAYDLAWLHQHHPHVLTRLPQLIDSAALGLAAEPPADALLDWAEDLLTAVATSDAGAWLRGQTCRQAGEWERSSADDLLELTFTIQDVRAPQRQFNGKSVDWHDRGPRHDLEWSWLLNRHAWLLDLIGAWQVSGETRYAEQADRLLCDWLLQNPRPLGYSATGPWRELEAGLRLAIESLRGERESELRARVHAFYERDVRPHYRPEGLTAVRRHKEEGDAVVLLTSASIYVAEAV